MTSARTNNCDLVEGFGFDHTDAGADAVLPFRCGDLYSDFLFNPTACISLESFPNWPITNSFARRMALWNSHSFAMAASRDAFKLASATSSE